MMRAVGSVLLDVVWGLALVAVGTALLTHAMATNGYRLSLYTVAPCAPAVQAEPHALSLNPLRAAP